VLSKSAKSILWPRYGAPEVAKNKKFSPPHYHHIVFSIHPLSQLRYLLTLFELQIWLLFDAFFCSTIYGLEVYWWWTCLFKIKWFVAHGENIDFQIDQRDNILIVPDVVYNQFCNPQCFGNSQQFSWQKSGYIDGYVEGREVEFDTPIKCCFPKYNVTICQRQDCQDLSFIRCSYYSLSFCFDHFILNKHVHHQ